MKVHDVGSSVVFSVDSDPASAYLLDLDVQISQNLKESSAKECISINTADIEELILLHGIGRVKAGRIIEYRQEHGKFKHLSELLNVKGIGPKIFERLKDHITLK